MKFFDALQIKDTGRKVSILDKIRTENWSLTTSEIEPACAYQKAYRCSLSYHNQVSVDAHIAVSDNVIKGRLVQELHWQVYGELTRILNCLLNAVVNNDRESALEIIQGIKEEYTYRD